LCKIAQKEAKKNTHLNSGVEAVEKPKAKFSWKKQPPQKRCMQRSIEKEWFWYPEN